mmetsp:Transcript_15693/g.35168  ORF Transcript_15693/g.35168 Transcript_15693/m.35168 type:complete len:90 (-) Transcript_15693:916-1185(-)
MTNLTFHTSEQRPGFTHGLVCLELDVAPPSTLVYVLDTPRGRELQPPGQALAYVTVLCMLSPATEVRFNLEFTTPLTLRNRRLLHFRQH